MAPLEEQLLSQFGPLLTTSQLAKILHRTPKGLSDSLSRKSAFAEQFGTAKVRFGRRVYFRTCDIASILSGVHE